MAKILDRFLKCVNRNLLSKPNFLQPVAATRLTDPSTRLYEIAGVPCAKVGFELVAEMGKVSPQLVGTFVVALSPNLAKNQAV